MCLGVRLTVAHSARQGNNVRRRKESQMYMHRQLALALGTVVAVLTLLPAHVMAVPTDRGFGYGLCASVIGSVTRIADSPVSRLVTVHDERLARSRDVVLPASATVENRRGDRVPAVFVRRGDRVSLYMPAPYSAPTCTLTRPPRVVFALDLSR